MSEYVLEAKNLTNVYSAGETKVTALSNVDLQVEKGDFVSIMGPSGSGKTTLLIILGCFDKPTAGQVIIDGVDVTKMREAGLPKIRAEKIGFVFQNFNLIPTLSALENIELPMERGGVPKDKRRGRALELLESVGLTKDKADRKPNKLSSGEQQRVAIARALANGPAIILADEPTGNLDSKTGREIVQLLRKLSREEGRTIILVTHDKHMASLSNRMLSIRDGKLLKKA